MIKNKEFFLNNLKIFLLYKLHLSLRFKIMKFVHTSSVHSNAHDIQEMVV